MDFKRGTFRVRGDTVEVVPADRGDTAIRVEFFRDEIDRISEIDMLTGEIKNTLNHIAIFRLPIGLAAGTGSYAGLSALLRGMSGFPSSMQLRYRESIMDDACVYVLWMCTCIFYETTHTVTESLPEKFWVSKEIWSGICLGVIEVLIPAGCFRRRADGVLMKEYAGYMAIVLIGVAFGKYYLQISVSSLD